MRYVQALTVVHRKDFGSLELELLREVKTIEEDGALGF